MWLDDWMAWLDRWWWRVLLLVVLGHGLMLALMWLWPCPWKVAP
jgi:hypothetical protein